MRDVMTMILCGALAIGIYAYFAGGSKEKKTESKIGKQAEMQVTPVEIGGASFTLTNQFGEKVTEKTLQNSKSLVFFGFTHCPDICPAALSVMTEAYVQLGSNIDDLKPVFITIDPENDTPEVIQEYLLNYNKDILGLTGDRAEIEKLVKSYKAYAGKSDDGQVMHSDLIYFMDEKGKYITHFNRENTPADIVKYMKKTK